MAGVQEPGDGYVSAVSQPQLPSSAFRTGMFLEHQTLLLFVPQYNAFKIQNMGFRSMNEGSVILSPPLKNFWCTVTEATLSGKEAYISWSVLSVSFPVAGVFPREAFQTVAFSWAVCSQQPPPGLCVAGSLLLSCV